jgi:hypothetical protein
VITTFRSAPCGRGGAGGSSPAAMRSVQSANMASARGAPNTASSLAMSPPAWPDWMRRIHASREDLKTPSSVGISRVALFPI